MRSRKRARLRCVTICSRCANRSTITTRTNRSIPTACRRSSPITISEPFQKIRSRNARTGSRCSRQRIQMIRMRSTPALSRRWPRPDSTTCTAPRRETDSMAPPTKIGKRVAGGFTLAAVLAIMSIMLIFVAFTVPRQWSAVMQRERELRTIYVMQQYAKAIEAFRLKNNIFPVSMSQLADARQPRFLRCPKDGCIDPLTGEVDWLLIPQSQARPPGGGNPPPPGVLPQTATAQVGVPMKDYAGGPFVGIRPPKNGNSLIIFKGADHYEQWMYTAFDYQVDRTARQQAAQKVWQ